MNQDVNSAGHRHDQRAGTVYLVGVAVAAAFTFALVKGHFDLGAHAGAAARDIDARAAQAPFDPARFMLNALLVPALDGEALPLRWVDPRPALHCRSGADVRVNGAPLVPGTLVPDKPFELEWHADACRPFGASGPRFDGRVKLTVFHEDWGFTALVRPRGLTITTPWHASQIVRTRTVSMPQSTPQDDPFAAD
jgi:hypothetical protein